MAPTTPAITAPMPTTRLSALDLGAEDPPMGAGEAVAKAPKPERAGAPVCCECTR